MNIQNDVTEFIFNYFIKGDESKKLNDNTSFLEEGIIDSVGVLELVSFIEKEFNIVVEDEEIIPENIDSVNRLVSFIQSKLPMKTSQTNA